MVNHDWSNAIVVKVMEQTEHFYLKLLTDMESKFTALHTKEHVKMWYDASDSIHCVLILSM